jgi:hypothetical protein
MLRVALGLLFRSGLWWQGIQSQNPPGAFFQVCESLEILAERLEDTIIFGGM